jgi:MFS family permease
VRAQNAGVRVVECLLMAAGSTTVGSPAAPTERASAGDAPARRFGALRYRSFSLLWVGLLLSNSGTWMQTTAQSYLVYQVTSSPLALGLLGLAFGLPMLLLPPLGGVMADRVDRLVLLRVTNVLWIAMTLLLAVLTWSGQVQYWQILLLSFLSAVTLAFDNPTRQALVPDLVPRSELMSAISLNSVAFTGASLLGPAIAGQILFLTADVHRGAALVFLLNALSYLAVLVPVVFWIRLPPREAAARRAHQAAADGPAPSPYSRNTSIGADLLEGLRYVKARRPLVLLLLLTAVTSVFGRSFSQLMPVFARDVLGVGPGGLGMMYSAPGAGTLLGGAVLAAVAGNLRDRRHLVTGATVVFTLTVFGFALSRWYGLSLALLFAGGVAGTVAGATIATLLQAQSPGRLRGRVMSLQTLAIIGMSPLGAFLSGALATAIPAPLAVCLTAAVILVFLAAVVVTQPAWRDIGDTSGEPAGA